jgi:hypothetical protein
MTRLWLAAAAAGLLLCGCNRNSAEQTYPVSAENAYAALTRVDLADTPELGFPGGSVETELEPMQQVTWRFMLDNLETGRMTARLTPAGASETAVAIDVDTSHAVGLSPMQAEQFKLLRPYQIAFVTEKFAATLEGRDFDRARVNAMAQDMGFGGAGQALDVLANRDAIRGEGERLGRQAQEIERQQNAASAGGGAPPSYAEQQARKWTAENQ